MSAKVYIPPKGWFKTACDARDTESVFQFLVEHQNAVTVKGLPPLKPSYELAELIVNKKFNGQAR